MRRGAETWPAIRMDNSARAIVAELANALA